MKLIGSKTSPYVRKIRVLLAEKRLPFEFVEENVWSPETTVPRHNPIGKVPTLLLDEGEALYDSRGIAEYVDSLPGENFLPPHTAERGAPGMGARRWAGRHGPLRIGKIELELALARRMEVARGIGLPVARFRGESAVGRRSAAAHPARIGGGEVPLHEELVVVTLNDGERVAREALARDVPGVPGAVAAPADAKPPALADGGVH